ncbi:MAG: Pr6Pr family membrane protein [Atopobiaceae bacterium]|nr:Pr6Pr family membrane protein [Atopobiaceae bacterium]
METNVLPSALLNAATAILALYSWLSLMFSWGKSSGLLADRGLRSLRYFTVQSNLFSGAVSLACVVAYLVLGSALPSWLLVLKLVATTAVMLTCIVVILVLVPAYDLKSMYMGSNLWMHLILPLMAALDCCLFQPVGTLPWQTTFLSILPSALYGIGYLRNILIHGAEENGVVYDFYHFLRWGSNKLAIIALVAFASTWGISLLLHTASRLLYHG